jgi:hypothetical protein
MVVMVADGKENLRKNFDQFFGKVFKPKMPKLSHSKSI